MVNMFLKRVKTFIEIFYNVYLEHKIAILFLTFIGFFSAILEGIGINSIIPLFSFVTGNTDKGNDIISRFVENFFKFLNIEYKLKYLIILIALLFIFKAILFVLSEYIRIKITANYEEKMRNNLFKKFLKTEWPYLLKQKLGHLHTVLMVNVQTSANILSYISSFIIIFSGLIIYILVAINISFRITSFSLILSALIFFGMLPFIKKLRNYSYNLEKINRKIGHHINENIFGLKTIKVMNVIKDVIEDAEKNFREFKIVKIVSSIWEASLSSIMEPASLIFVLVIFSYSYKSPNFNLASFVAVVYLIKQIFSYTTALQKKILSFNATIPYFKNILDYQNQAEQNFEKEGGKSKFIFNNSLDFNNVTFSYLNRKNTFNKLSFSIKKGETVGLIGPSGAGKTTLVDLILRLFKPEKGSINLDGINIEKINLEDWRNNIGYVSQDIFLMNDTIENNIRFYDDNISDELIQEVARKANIYDFIQTLPDKFNTIIGERGVELSVGQRQRVVIARVLARNPNILILDEATSALDNESELKIQKIIENLKGKLTIFVIAHRLSTLTNSDRLLVLDRGMVIEQGSPRDLLKDVNSYFYKVYNIRK